MKNVIFPFIGFLFFACSKNQIIDVAYQNAAVVSAYPEATLSGVKILQNGGNVIDAAVATYFTLAVVYPQAGNLGGGGFLVYRTQQGEIFTLDFREVAPMLATENMYIDENGNPVENLSTKGHLAVGVPGSVIGMYEAHRKWGFLPWNVLLEDAIHYAENGYILTELQSKELNKAREDFEKYNRGNYCFCQKEKWKSGDTLIQNDLAQTLRRIAKKGAEEMRTGQTAKLFLQEMKLGNGIVTQQDLLEYRPTERKPLKISYKDYEVFTMPLPSAGGVTLAQLLGMATHFEFKKNEFLKVRSVHIMAELERLAFEDRVAHLGDPDFVDINLEAILSQNYLINRASTISENKAGKSDLSAVSRKESEQTTHISIADKLGNAVSLTTTLNSSFGSKVCVEGAGFLLNNEMDDFSVNPGTPNQFGLIGSMSNKIEPRKKMLSSMTPTIVTRNGKLFLVLGTPGGTTIPTSVFQVFMNVVHFELNIQDAVNAPRFHHQWIPDVIYYEEDFENTELLTELEKMGHQLKKRETIGRFDAILIDKNGKIYTGADRRGNDFGSGY